MVVRDLSPRLKWQVCEADHSPSSSAKVKNVWSYMFSPLYVFMAWYLINKKENIKILYKYIDW
jgi:hypothetical protein